MAVSEFSSDRPHSAIDVEATDSESAQVALALDAVEMLVQDDLDEAERKGRELEARADLLCRADLGQRARLIQADVLGRRGDTAGAAVIERDVLAWAVAHDDDYVLARAQRLQATFYTRMGDHPAALECAVIAVDRLAPDVPRRLVADHLMCLALAYCGVQTFDPARERFIEVASVAEDLSDHKLQVRALNNLAFMEYLAGRPEQSMKIAQRLTVLAENTGVQLNVSALETTARAQMSVGSYPEAIHTLAIALDSTDRITESDDLAAVHLSLAECHRQQGSFDLAEMSLELAHEQCDENGLAGVRPQVVREQSALAAARGDYRSAYDLHREFHRLEAEQLSAERESRASILATVFETDAAVTSSKHYREMSLRDPLTGLYNRRYIEETLPRMLLRVKPASPLSIAIADLDHFKQVNDLHSHDIGDSVLRQLSLLLKTACLPDGFAARLGGEEFLLVLPGVDAMQAPAVAQAFVTAVRMHDWSPLVADLPITVSLGIVTVDTRMAPVSSLLSAADRLLYEAKSNGRDRVVAGPYSDF